MKKERISSSAARPNSSRQSDRGRNAERLDTALSAANVGLFEIDFIHQSVWCSPEFGRVVGRTLSFAEMSQGAWPVIHADDQARIRALVSSARGSGAVPPHETRVVLPTGKCRWVNIRATIHQGPDGSPERIVGAVLDVDERKRQDLSHFEASELAQANARRLELALNAAKAGVLEIDLAQQTIWYSPEVVEILGQAPKVNRPDDAPWPMCHPEDRERLDKMLTRTISLRLDPIDFRILRPSGEVRWIRIHSQLEQPTEGPPTKVVVLVIDIDDQKQQEFELIEAREDARAASEAKSKFLANMSHELRTPLTSITGFSQLMEERNDLPEEARHFSNRIRSASEALLSIISDVLDFAKLEDGQVELEVQPVSIERLLEESVGILSIQAAAKNIDLFKDVAAETPRLIEGDAARLRQVLLNLLGNAVKFTPSGSVAVRASYQFGKNKLRVAVSDTGPGISAEAVARLFERFSQAEVAINRTHGGTGLGLAISKGIIDLMGGEIGVDTEVGHGATFWFEVPARPIEAGPVSFPTDCADLEWPPLRLLVVDDTAVNRELVMRMLQPLGIEIVEASGGSEGVQAAMNAPFDLILMDVRMPGVDGLEATRIIRQASGVNRSTPILALTADVEPENAVACRAAGMDDVLAKPISPKQLISKIAEWSAHAPIANTPRNS